MQTARQPRVKTVTPNLEIRFFRFCSFRQKKHLIFHRLLHSLKKPTSGQCSDLSYTKNKHNCIHWLNLLFFWIQESLLLLLLCMHRFVVAVSRVWLFVTPRTIPTRLPCPWLFPGKNTEVDSHALLHDIFPAKGSDPLGVSCLAGGSFTTE